MLISEEILEFFKVIPPFQFLEESVLMEIVSNLSMEFFPKGSLVLTQDGPPSDSLRVIKKGGVKVFLSNDDEIVIDYKSEGDSFGYLSLISGDRSRANVLAIEDTLCYQLTRDTILQVISKEPHFGEYFMKSFFQRYLDKTYKEMRNRNLLFKEGEKILYTTPVSSLIVRDAVSAKEETTIKEAAAIMSRHRISSLVLVDGQGNPVGIITDRDLREKVVSKGLDTLTPVKEIMSSKLVSIESQMTCFDALAAMIRNNIHHLLITDDGNLKGIVTNHDFMLLQGTSPLSLLKNIDRQKDIESLPAIHNKINQITSLLLKEGVKAGYILRIITELHDRLLHKIVELSVKEIGDPPAPFAFFVYGSEGRKEETFKTVFRCAILYEDRKTYNEKREIDEYCHGLLEHLQNILKRCVFTLFDIHPLGGTIPIYGDISEWRKNILNALRSGNEKYAATAKKFLDLRAIYGDRTAVKALREELFGHIRKDFQLGSVLIEEVPDQKSLIGFFKQFVVDEEGEQKEKLDIKQKAILQIVDALRPLAIAYNIHQTSTVERLNFLSRKGIIPLDLRNDISSAFEFLLHLLLHAQREKKEMNKEIDNFIEPAKLSLLEKKTLKEVFQIIPRLKKTVKNSYRQEVLA